MTIDKLSHEFVGNAFNGTKLTFIGEKGDEAILILTQKINELIDVVNKQLSAYSEYVVETTHERRDFLEKFDILNSVRGLVDTLDKSDYETWQELKLHVKTLDAYSEKFERLEKENEKLNAELHRMGTRVQKLEDRITGTEKNRSEQIARTIDKIVKLDHRMLELEDENEKLTQAIHNQNKRLLALESKEENPNLFEPIKGCPWCQEKPTIFDNISDLSPKGGFIEYEIGCMNDDCDFTSMSTLIFSTQQEAIEAWNNRKETKK